MISKIQISHSMFRTLKLKLLILLVGVIITIVTVSGLCWTDPATGVEFCS